MGTPPNHPARNALELEAGFGIGDRVALGYGPTAYSVIRVFRLSGAAAGLWLTIEQDTPAPTGGRKKRTTLVEATRCRRLLR